METKQSKYKEEIRHVLILENVNGLARGPGLLENQLIHINRIKLKIIVILVVMCRDEGYNNFCMKSSHNKFKGHGRDVWVLQDNVD